MNQVILTEPRQLGFGTSLTPSAYLSRLTMMLPSALISLEVLMPRDSTIFALTHERVMNEVVNKVSGAVGCYFG